MRTLGAVQVPCNIPSTPPLAPTQGSPTGLSHVDDSESQMISSRGDETTVYALLVKHGASPCERGRNGLEI